ncbi:MAG: hypothetical protein WB697_08030 [Stellaceae bacterium]
MSISLQYPGTGQVRVFDEGWSWSCFFGATVLGIPLFQRGLVVWGAAMLVLDVSTLIVDWIDTAAAASLYGWLGLIGLGASVFFGFRGNAMAAEHALARGWQHADTRRKWFD